MRRKLSYLVVLSALAAGCATNEGDLSRSELKPGSAPVAVKPDSGKTSTDSKGEANPYNGTWDVELKSLQGVWLNGKVVVADRTGTWKMTVSNTDNACVGILTPIAIQRSTEDQLVFETLGSKALTGCKDGLVTLKRTDDTTLEGALKIGPEFRLKLTRR